MHIEEIIQKIVPADRGCMKLAQTRFDNLIKPVGSLAKLEEMTSRYCGIKGIYEKEDLDYPKRDLLVWCGIEEAAQAEKIYARQMAGERACCRNRCEGCGSARNLGGGG